MEVITLNVVIFDWKKNSKNEVGCDSYMVCGFSAGLESENI